MLEICISLRRYADDETIAARDTAKKITGDIICAKLQPAVWGNEEKRAFLITKLEDAALQSSIDASGTTIRSYPYAVYDEDNKISNRSKYRVDIDMFEGSPGLDPENTTQEPCPPTQNSINTTHLVIADLIFNDSVR